MPYRPYEHGNIFNHAPLRTRKLLIAQGRDPKVDRQDATKRTDAHSPGCTSRMAKLRWNRASKAGRLWDNANGSAAGRPDKEARKQLAEAGT